MASIDPNPLTRPSGSCYLLKETSYYYYYYYYYYYDYYYDYYYYYYCYYWSLLLPVGISQIKPISDCSRSPSRPYHENHLPSQARPMKLSLCLALAL